MADVSRRSIASPATPPGRPSTTSSYPNASGTPKDDKALPSRLREDARAPSSDDDEDDSSDDSDGDEVIPKQTAISRWTLEEQAAVMNFYGLSNLYTQFWNEDQMAAGPVKSPSVASFSNEPAPAPIVTPEPALDLSDPLGIKESIYGRKNRRMNLTADSSQISHLLITSKNFNPTQFLREVHRTTSYRDFELGAERLQAAIDDRMDVIRNLVKTHFAKFVNAKSTIDSFYQEMRRQNLISSEDYGITPFAKSIDELGRKAPDLYAPMLERRRKAEKIRITLSILEQWKFFFNLPSVLQDYIRKSTYDAAVRDYKKGKYLMQSSFSTAPSPTSTNPTIITNNRERDKDTNTLLPQHHRKVFEKVWAEVDKIVDGLRKELFRLLGDPTTPLEVQERHIMYLIDLDADVDPVWFYLENQYKWICRQLVDVYSAHADRLNALHQAVTLQTSASVELEDDEVVPEAVEEPEAERDEDDGGEEEERMNEGDNIIVPAASIISIRPPITRLVVKRSGPMTLEKFRKALAGVSSGGGREYERILADDMDVQLWKAMVRLCRMVCDILVECLPDFWKLCRIFSEGRLQKQRPTDPETGQPAQQQQQPQQQQQHQPKKRADAKKLEQCQEMVKNIMEIYSTILTNAFYLGVSLEEVERVMKGGSDFTEEKRGTPNDEGRKKDEMKIDVAKPVKTLMVDTSKIVSSPRDSTTDSSSHPSTSLTIPTPTRDPSAVSLPAPHPNLQPPTLPTLPLETSSFLRTHPLTTCYFVTRVVMVFSKCVGEVRGMRLSGATPGGYSVSGGVGGVGSNGVVAIVSEVLERVRSRCVEGVVAGVLSESTHFHTYETYTYDHLSSPTQTSTHSTLFHKSQSLLITDSTAYLKLFYRFLKYTTRSLHRISYTPLALPSDFPSTPRSKSTSLNNDEVPMKTRLGQMVRGNLEMSKRGVFGSLWCVGEGLRGLAVEEVVKGGEGAVDTGAAVRARFQAADVRVLSEGGRRRVGGGKWVDVRQVDTRTLVILANLAYMREILIPKMVKFYGERFEGDVGVDIKTLNEAATHLDFLLFQNYIRRKAMKIRDIVRNGILFSGLDWADLARPQEIRSHCYQILLMLVMVHSEVNDVSRLLVRRVLSELLYRLAQELLTTFRLVDRFSVGGMLQATLETEFLQQTLASYLSPPITQIFNLIYDSIDHSSIAASENASLLTRTEDGGLEFDMTHPEMADMVEHMKGFLEEAKEGTRVQFSCFEEEGGGVRNLEGEEEE
ncbi:hypothetical protein HDV00_009068 [Rhizophlyctis rosea]|nr:hypothetical protein HDV00_009068 [Rhizophlyctis rosea]